MIQSFNGITFCYKKKKDEIADNLENSQEVKHRGTMWPSDSATK